MYFVGLDGQATSGSPGSSGAPTECRPGTKSASSQNTASAFAPIRVMMCMDTTTYAESVSSTPSSGDSASSGPMQYGITYMVRPRMEPRYSSVMIAFMSSG